MHRAAVKGAVWHLADTAGVRWLDKDLAEAEDWTPV